MKSSIVTCGFTTFNSEETIERALISALEQSYKDIEILIVDDYSSDSTIDKIDSLLSKNNIKYKLIKHSSNLGVAKSRNTLINNAKGEFLVFFDSDDISHKNRVSEQVSCIKEFELQKLNKNFKTKYSPLCYSDREIFFKNKTKLYCKAMYINIDDFNLKDDLIGALLFCKPFPKKSESGSTATCMLCARIETLKFLNGFNPILRRYEDLDLAIRAIMQKIPICKINKSLVNQYYTNFEYKKNELTYERKLIYIHRNWLKKKNLYKFAFYFSKFKKNILELNLIYALYYFILLILKNPYIFFKKIISSFDTILFTIKLKLIKNKIKKLNI
tara:strand:+ start:2379 stop:3368 length:990 start_codon:yes stop_codon:yes gene_type:complete